ncbi:MAG: Rv3235 family protein [Specibacter sp.]
MNTMALPESAPTVVRLVARPAPEIRTPDSGDQGNSGTVIKMPRRPGSETAPSPAAAQAGTPSTLALDPLANERALVAEMSKKISQAVLEVLCGARSVQQLARWLDTMCFNALTTRARLYAQACQEETRHSSGGVAEDNVRTLHHQPIVHSVHVSPVIPGIYETSVVIADKTRFRAIAMRFEESQGAWKVTALRIG